MKKYIFLLILFLATYLTQAQSQSNLKKYFTDLAAKGQFNGNILVAENGKVVYAQSFGYADFGHKVANVRTIAFPIASVSKTIVATAIMQLQQAGKLDVNNPVKQYLLWFPYPSVTVKHLLSHSGGMPAYNAFFDGMRKQEPKRIFTNADFEAGVVANPTPLKFEPGEKNQYDNVNYLVLSLLIEKISGMPCPQYVEQHILKPANMTHTRFMPLGAQYSGVVPAGQAQPYLYPYTYSDSLVLASAVPYVKEYWTAYQFSGFGDYISTVEDLLKYDEAYYDGRLLNNMQQTAMFTPVKLNNGRNGSFGLGWELFADTSMGRIVYHNGNATGLSCTLIRNLSKKQTIILFDNIHLNNSQSTGFAALNILNGKTVKWPRQDLTAIYAKTLLKDGADAARKKFFTLKQDTANYRFSEDDINLMGYAFLGGPNNPNPFKFPEISRQKEALATFKLNTELFPNSWNVFDSYGEALAAAGRKAEAIAMYKRSIELNPNNEGGKKALALLL